MKPVILSIETSTIACSVALSYGDAIFHRFEIIPQLHTQRLFPMIREILAEACISLNQIEAIAVGRGPGSFTGLRIAVSVAQGLGFGLGIPVYPISTLAALALQAREIQTGCETVITTLDARMQEVYVAAYTLCTSPLKALHGEQIMSITHFEQWKNNFAAPLLHLGTGLGAVECYPRATEIALLAKASWENGQPGILAENVLPVYLRDTVAMIPKKSGHTRGVPLHEDMIT